MFEVQITTPESTVYTGKASSLQAPGQNGLFGILSGHAPMISALSAGKVSLKTESNNDETFDLTGGFLEVKDNHVIILADAIVQGDA